MLEAYLGVFGTWFEAYLGNIGYMIWGIFLEILLKFRAAAEDIPLAALQAAPFPAVIKLPPFQLSSSCPLASCPFLNNPPLKVSRSPS
jgi:hypothetical protein